MNLRKVENSELLTTLLRLDDKKNPLLPVEAEVFFLTSPFIERGYRPFELTSPVTRLLRSWLAEGDKHGWLFTKSNKPDSIPQP
jgi:hypothetical protein